MPIGGKQDMHCVTFGQGKPTLTGKVGFEGSSLAGHRTRRLEAWSAFTAVTNLGTLGTAQQRNSPPTAL